MIIYELLIWVEPTSKGVFGRWESIGKYTCPDVSLNDVVALAKATAVNYRIIKHVSEIVLDTFAHR